MKNKKPFTTWPTLEARLKNALTTRKRAVEQLKEAGITPLVEIDENDNIIKKKKS